MTRKEQLIAAIEQSNEAVIEQLWQTLQTLPQNASINLTNPLQPDDLHSDLHNLVKELYAEAPADDITDEEILQEINAVRQQSASV
jgi:hypothetical protein